MYYLLNTSMAIGVRASLIILGLVSLPAATSAQGALGNGEIHSGSISVPGEIDTWTFTASQGDFIGLSIGEVLPAGPDPGFVPWLRLQNPNGAQIANQSGILVAQISLIAPLSGTYTVLVGSNDSFNDAVGSYRLTLAKAPGTFGVPSGDQGGPMTNGENHAGSIYVGDLDMWTFTAAQNDHISLSAGEPDFGEVDPGFNPWIRLISPAGAVIGNQASVLVAQISVAAPLSGTYTVIVSTGDSFNDAAGDYLLTLAKAPGTVFVPDGDQGGPMTNGANHQGHIHRGDLDMWTFTAAQNDFLALSAGESDFGEVDPGFNPWIRLISPTGAIIGNQAGVLVAQISVAAPLSGTYTVIVATGDSFNDSIGDYRLTLARIPGTFNLNLEPEDDDGGPMTNGGIHAGSIRRGDLDQWTFTAAQNDYLAVSIGEPPFGEVDPGFNPWIRLISPTGAVIGSQAGVLVAQINVVAPLSGTYTVLVSTGDSFNDAEGNYRLTVARIPGTFTVSSGDQGGAMTNNMPHPGDIYTGDLDQWTFHATQNKAITVTITEPPPGEIDPGFNPWIRVVSPAGVLLMSTSGPVTAQINFTAPLTGTYTVLVGTADSFNDAAGSYVLTVIGATTTLPTMALDRASLRFGAVTNGAILLMQTAAQTVRLTQTGAGTVAWTATSNQSWLQVSPASGSGSAELSISVVSVGGLPAGMVGGAITLAFTGAANSPGPIDVTLTLFLNGTSANPIGVVDTPGDNQTGVTGAVPFTGWAVDDIEVRQVAVCRAAVAPEVAPVDPNCGGTAQIFVGLAVFIDGARPDVAGLYSTYPVNTKAGWGFMVLTNMLPNQGNGTYQFFMWAQDREGNSVVIGTRMMTCTNATATKPFGAIDTPSQGGVAAGGAYAVFGWVLSRVARADPPGGGTVTVLVDGTPVGSPGGWTARSDLTGLFAGFPGIGTALGVYGLDTTTLTNGLHTIVWVVVDNLGVAEGIGSRFFAVSNGAGALTASQGMRSTGTATPERETSVPRHGIESRPYLDDGPVRGRRGWDLTAPLETFAADAHGRVVVRSEEVNRVELQVGTSRGALRTSEGLRPLPVGSQLDASTGVFTWAPGVGFVGAYDLVFEREDGTTRDVRIVLQPKGSHLRGSQVVIDSPRAQQDVGQPFLLAGWAADLDAALGTGVATVHAWAYPLTGGPPVFLGATAYGGARPDVAAVHGEQFDASGFGLHVQGLTPGNYDLAVFAWNIDRAGFVPATVVRVTVRP